MMFAMGFVVPLTWFIAAFLPLPQRPETFGDLEKRASVAVAEREYNVRRSQAQNPTRPRADDWGSLDVVTKLRLDRHIHGVEELKFQNARWWRNLNRWMCCVGIVVIVVVIVLAVLGSKQSW
jgi:hypothetical protein